MRRGFSLLETLVTLLLVSLVFGLVMNLITQGLRTFRASNEKDEAAQAANVALDRLICELREASSMLAPTVAAPTASQIEFVKVDPASTTRIPNPLPVPLPGSWDPDDPAFHLAVRYRVDNQQLVRDVGPPGAAYQESSALGSQVSGLQCLRRGQGVYAVVLSVRYRQVVKSYCGTVLCPLQR